ncbi:hypothetical protein ETAA8_36590 [Anatilimnocola aggregata]|uniref:DUF1353 domain-containing protein n=1 Tax=Anatilimnocola aggregata TaxID=2528021 RepID=A0A517YEA7_9BACT|nr:DUF1353 domain-containing protein [Anatilimnocola aggregata]QDU28556.1 hypothetical protein ETAA8_36590 [Anatilimnocola aggregata]
MRISKVPILLAGMFMFLGCEIAPVPEATSFGRFEGDVVASWDNDGRNMTLRENFIFIDSQNRAWHAPAGAVVNGASIPAAFWSVIGGPFEGQYRSASVVHDVGCHQMTDSWQDVHRMFYEACRCGGVEEGRAKMLYYAVYHFGPRWEVVNETQVETTSTPDGTPVQREVSVPTMVRIDPPPPTAEEVEQVAALIDEENPAPAVIERTDREALHRRPRGSYGKGRPKYGPSGNTVGDLDRSNASRPTWQRPDSNGVAGSTTPWNGPQFRSNERPPGFDPRGMPPQGSRDRLAQSERWDGAQPGRNAVDGQRSGPLPAITAEENQWAQNIVRAHLQAQAGEHRPAEYNVERTERGYRVQVQYVQLNEQGQPAAYTGSSMMRLSRDGRVMEMINR